MTTPTTSFPMIPTLSPRTVDEGAIEFGLRAFAFLVGERLSACLLDTETLQLAMHASLCVVTGADTHATARAAMHATRLDIATTVARRERDAADALAIRELCQKARQAAHAAAQAPNANGGARVPARRPVPIIPPAAGALRTM